MSGTASPGIIQFAEIPYTWKVPGNYLEVKAAIDGNAVLPFPACGLIMGQMLSAGASGVAGTAYRLLNGNQANALFGAGSQVAKMCWRWLKANPYTPVDVIGFADAAGATKAAGLVTIAGTATAAGTLPFYFHGVRVPVAVSAGDTAAVVAANLFAAMQMQGTAAGYVPLSLLPAYTASTAVVSWTAKNGGTLGNALDVRVNAQKGDTIPAGLTVAITPMSGGATDPAATIAAALAGINTWYTDVAFAWTDTTNIGVLSNWLIQNYGAMAKQDCQGYAGLSQTYGTALATLFNCKYISDLPMQNSLSPPWEVASALAGACCLSTAQAPSLQMKKVPLPGIVCPADADVFSLNEREALLLAGHSTYLPDGNGGVLLERVVTTYRLDPGNIPNNSWFDLQATKVPTRVRYDWDAYVDYLFPRNNLAADGTLAATYAPNVVTPSILKASWTARSAIYEQNGWIQNSAVTAKQSTFAIDPNDGNRVNSRQQIQVMGNLMVLAGSLEFISNN